MNPEAAFTAAVAHQARGLIDVEAFHWRMRDDPRWAVAVRYACEHGIPLSVFLGRVVEPGEPVWDEDDRDVALGYTLWISGVCGSCGLHRLDWEHERDETWKGTIVTCFGCVELADTRAQIPDSVSAERRATQRVFLTPRTERERILLEAVERGDLDVDDLPSDL